MCKDIFRLLFPFFYILNSKKFDSKNEKKKFTHKIFLKAEIKFFRPFFPLHFFIDVFIGSEQFSPNLNTTFEESSRYGTNERGKNLGGLWELF
jgi:hypothetical protein